MADTYKASYSCSFTPIHVDEYSQAGHADTSLNTTYTKNLVKTSDSASSIGGGMQNMTDTSGSNNETAAILSGAADIATTTAYQEVKGKGGIAASNKDVKLLAIKITAADASSTDSTCDCIISLDGGSNGHIHLVGKGAAVALPLVAGIQTDDVEFKSTSGSTKSVIAIQVLKGA